MHLVPQLHLVDVVLHRKHRNRAVSERHPLDGVVAKVEAPQCLGARIGIFGALGCRLSSGVVGRLGAWVGLAVEVAHTLGDVGHQVDDLRDVDGE